MTAADLDKLFAPTVVLALIAVLLRWAVGAFNNALQISASARREPKPGSTTDVVIASLKLKKLAVTRVRIEVIRVAVLRRNGKSGEGNEAQNAAAEIEAQWNAAALEDAKGIILVPGDSLTFEAVTELPASEGSLSGFTCAPTS
jgi:hypothetical protein